MNERYDLFIEQYKEKEGITERLKAKDQIRWAEKMKLFVLILYIHNKFVTE